MDRSSRAWSGAFVVLSILTAAGCGRGSQDQASFQDQAPPPVAEPAAPAVEPPPAPQAPASAQAHSAPAQVPPEERPRHIVPQQPPPPATVTVTIPAGTKVQATLATALTSETALVGDRVSAILTAPVIVGDRVAFPSGSRIEGSVTDVKSATKGFKDTGGALSLNFDTLVGPDGRTATISSALTRVAEGSGKKKAGIIGGSAAGGALLGKVLGKDVKGGAVIGGAIGTAVAGSTKGREATIEADEELSLTLEESARLAIKR